MKLKIKSNEFKLENRDKVQRVINGSQGSNGQLVGGIGNNATPIEIITEYDRMGGYITCERGGFKAKVKIGSFYDFKNKQPLKTPNITFVFRDINGDEVELEDGEELPMSVRAVVSGKKKKKTKVNLDPVEEDEEESEEEDDEIVEEEEDEVEEDTVAGEEIEEVSITPQKKTTAKKKK